MKPGWRAIPHTSDLRLEITAPDWLGFYRAAAEGLLTLYELGPGQGSAVKKTLSFAAPTPEDLLVAWLSELIFLISVKKQVPAGITVLEASPTSLRVELSLLAANQV